MSQGQSGLPDKVTGQFYLASEYNLLKNLIDSNSLDAESRLQNIVVVKSLDDLSDYLNGSFYDLPAGRYNFSASVDFGTVGIRLIEDNKVYRFDGTVFDNQITYTGTGSFITNTGVGQSLDFRNLFISTPNATAINLINGNSLILQFPVFIGCKKAVELNTFGFMTIEPIAMVGCENGIDVTDVDTCSIIVAQWSSGQDNNGVGFKFNGANSSRLFITSVDARPMATESFIEIGASWGGTSTIEGGIFDTSGGGDFFLPGSRDFADPSITVKGVGGVADSMAAGCSHFTGNGTQTVISSSNTPVKITGTWVDCGQERFTFDASGRWTYTGLEPINAIVRLLTTCDAVGGGTRVMSAYVAKNGVVLSESKGTAEANTGTQIGCIARVPMVTGDFLEGWVENNDNSNNILVTTATFVQG